VTRAGRLVTIAGGAARGGLTKASDWSEDTLHMPIVRALTACLAAVLVAGIAAGCAAGLSAEPRTGVSLAGQWKLDHAASDDPQKLLDHMREQAQKIISRRMQAAAAGPPAGPRGPRGAAGQEPVTEGEDIGSAGYGGPGGGARPDPLQRSPMAHIVMESVARGDFLTVRQTSAEFVLDYGGLRRSFTPGARSVVSAEGGVADQTSGWKGGEYVIEIKAQLGPTVTESYGLSKDGRQLVEKLHIGAGELPAVTLTRVYEPTRERAPPPLPSAD
jgi:hypothetical protein